MEMADKNQSGLMQKIDQLCIKYVQFEFYHIKWKQRKTFYFSY